MMTIKEVSVFLKTLSATALFYAPVSASDMSGDETVTRCEAFSDTLALAPITGVTIGATDYVAATGLLPAYCRIEGEIDPDIGFQARFPIKDWNGKYYQSGCGGFCGSIEADKPGFSNTINEALKKGYAAITTDNGHTGSLGDASWAKDNLPALKVYAHEGIRLTHDAGTALVKAYYGSDGLDKRYFSGCSNGGRMAAMAAQRYPHLFDGIIGGAGVMDLSSSGGLYGSWMYQANRDANGTDILTKKTFSLEKALFLERHVLDQCDAVDGSNDGLITTPYSCQVNLDALPACMTEPEMKESGMKESGAKNNSCFTAAEKSVLSKWYQGPRNSDGRRLYPGMPPGSERFLYVWFLDEKDGTLAPGKALASHYALYIGFETPPSDDFSVEDFDFDKHPPLLQGRSRLMDATDPDLSAFRDQGGKFLMWHGLADPLVIPENSIDWYRNVAARMGGYDQISDFLRFFTIPGKGHCWEMPGSAPDRFDPIDILEKWVEDGKPPQEITVHSADPRTPVKRLTLRPYPERAHIPR